MKHLTSVVYFKSVLILIRQSWAILCCLLMMAVFQQSLFAAEDVSLESVRIINPSPGQWSETHITMVNRTDDWKKCEVEIQLGELGKGLHSYIFPLELAPNMKRLHKAPVLVPEAYVKKVLKSQVIKSKKKPKGAPKRPSAPKKKVARKKRDTYSYTAILRINGVIVKRDKLIAIKAEENTIDLLSEFTIHKKEEPFNIVPVPDYEQISLQAKSLTVSGQRVKTSRFYNKFGSGRVTSDWQRQEKEVIHLGQDKTSALRERDLLIWCRGGGLLIVDPNFDNKRTWYAELDYQVGDVYVSDIVVKKLDLASLPQRSLHHNFGSDWVLLEDDRGIPYGAYRSLGSGRVVALNMPLSSLLGGSDDSHDKMISSLYPMRSIQQTQFSSLRNELEQVLSERNGFKVWPKWLVGCYLGVFILLSVGLIFLPKYKKEGEKKWLIWVVLLLVGAFSTTVVMLMSTDSHTRFVNVVVNFYDDVSNTRVQVGTISAISGQKRKFSLGVPPTLSWKKKVVDSGSKELKYDDGRLQWQDFLLPPGIQSLIHYENSEELTESLDGQLELSGKTMKIQIPKNWQGKQAWLLVGRSVWHIPKLQTGQSLEMNAGQLIVEYKSTDQTLRLLKAHCFSDQITLPSNNRAWLVKASDKTTLPVEVPKDCLVKNEGIDILNLKVEAKPGPLTLARGVNTIHFLKGRKNPVEVNYLKEYNGLGFEESSNNMGVTIMFRPPFDLNNFKPKKLKLSYDITSKGFKTPIQLRVMVDGKKKMSLENLKGEKELPLSMWQNGRVALQIFVPRELNASKATVNSWKVNTLELSMEGETL